MQAIKMIAVMFFLSISIHANILSSGEDIIGVWLTSSREGQVTIFKTGNYYYGKISWLKTPNDESGNPKLDIKNHDENLKKKRILGLLMLKGFEYNMTDNIWENGTIYDPKNGKTYSCKMVFTSLNTLEVRGYIGISMIGRTDIWTKVE